MSPVTGIHEPTDKTAAVAATGRPAQVLEVGNVSEKTIVLHQTEETQYEVCEDYHDIRLIALCVAVYMHSNGYSYVLCITNRLWGHIKYYN